MIWRFVPLAGTALFLGIAFCWRPWLQYRRYGTWGIVLFRSRSYRDAGVVLVFGLLIGAAIGIRLQVAAEEEYLLRTYGDEYRDYARRVGRFVAGVGRLR